MPMPHRTQMQVIKRRLVGKEGGERIKELRAILEELLRNWRCQPTVVDSIGKVFDYKFLSNFAISGGFNSCIAACFCFAAFGIPQIRLDVSSWIIVIPPACRSECKPAAPSSPMPVNMIPAARAPRCLAIDSNIGLPDGQWMSD